jgi:hypothetical protein
VSEVGADSKMMYFVSVLRATSASVLPDTRKSPRFCSLFLDCDELSFSLLLIMHDPFTVGSAEEGSDFDPNTTNCAYIAITMQGKNT